MCAAKAKRSVLFDIDGTLVAVATGDYDVAALYEAGADVVFSDLSDTHAALEVINTL